jgi:hypothetical protein
MASAGIQADEVDTIKRSFNCHVKDSLEIENWSGL